MEEMAELIDELDQMADRQAQMAEIMRELGRMAERQVEISSRLLELKELAERRVEQAIHVVAAANAAVANGGGGGGSGSPMEWVLRAEKECERAHHGAERKGRRPVEEDGSGEWQAKGWVDRVPVDVRVHEHKVDLWVGGRAVDRRSVSKLVSGFGFETQTIPLTQLGGW